MAESGSRSVARLPVVGFLAWLLPGLGHLFLGHRGRGIVFLVTVTATFWTGVAIGGAGGTVDPHERRLWFMAQSLAGGNALAAFALHAHVERQYAGVQDATPVAHWASAEVGVHYTGVAGLLNLLVILDALALAEITSRRSKGGGREPPQGTTA